MKGLPRNIIIAHEACDGFIVDLAIEALGTAIPVSGYSIQNHVEISNVVLLSQSQDSILVHAACLDDDECNLVLSDDLFDYEYLYSRKQLIRHDFIRFLAFILGQVKPNEAICKKARSMCLSLTFPNVNDATPNLEIVSVAADALELRVDLLREKGASVENVPRLRYVAEQLYAVRRRTEVPIIFTVRFDDSGGRWPLSLRDIAHRYLRKALQWGVEYIDVATSFSKEIKADLVQHKGSSLVVASYHNLKGGLKWSLPEVEQIYRQCCAYGDLVEMVGLATCQMDNFDLESFRVQALGKEYARPLIAFNTGVEGRLSRVMNSFLTPIKHPLLPRAAAPSQLSAAEINKDLSILGEIKSLTIHTFTSAETGPVPPLNFFEKCFNELCMPYSHRIWKRPSQPIFMAALESSTFGGAVIQPHMSTKTSLPIATTTSALEIGYIDTVYLENNRLKADNTSARGIWHTLVREFTPSAYAKQSVLILSHSFQAVAPAIYALKSLGCGKVYTAGFRIPLSSPLAEGSERCQTLKLSNSEVPFVIVSALVAEERDLLLPLLRGLDSRLTDKTSKRMFLDLGLGTGQNGPPWLSEVVASWVVGTADDVAAWTTVEMMKRLVNQNIPYDFVRMAAKRGYI